MAASLLRFVKVSSAHSETRKPPITADSRAPLNLIKFNQVGTYPGRNLIKPDVGHTAPAIGNASQFATKSVAFQRFGGVRNAG